MKDNFTRQRGAARRERINLMESYRYMTILKANILTKAYAKLLHLSYLHRQNLISNLKKNIKTTIRSKAAYVI